MRQIGFEMRRLLTVDTRSGPMFVPKTDTLVLLSVEHFLFGILLRELTKELDGMIV